MGREYSDHSKTWESSMKSLGNVLNALNCIPKMVGFMSYIFNYNKKKEFRQN